MDFDFADVITRMVEMKASDVHLTPGFPPAVRVRGAITPLEG
jgi:Tfp pilus assembly ATPase PilU